MAKRIWTYCAVRYEYGDAPGWVSHKPDLSDIAEPYLSAVREARRVVITQAIPEE
jgi:hypothetical protein